jgi:hypothetical protein
MLIIYEPPHLDGLSFQGAQNVPRDPSFRRHLCPLLSHHWSFRRYLASNRSQLSQSGEGGSGGAQITELCRGLLLLLHRTRRGLLRSRGLLGHRPDNLLLLSWLGVPLSILFAVASLSRSDGRLLTIGRPCRWLMFANAGILEGTAGFDAFCAHAPPVIVYSQR